MTGSAEDLQILSVVCTTKREWNHMVEIPSLAWCDFKRTLRTVALGFQEMVEALFCRECPAVSHDDFHGLVREQSALDAFRR